MSGTICIYNSKITITQFSCPIKIATYYIFRFKKNKIVFEGFNSQVSKNFIASIKKIGGTTKDASNLIDDAAKFRIKVAEMKNVLFEGGNINVGVKEFNDLMFERSYKYLLNDYKIFDMNMGFVTKFKPRRGDSWLNIITFVANILKLSL